MHRSGVIMGFVFYRGHLPCGWMRKAIVYLCRFSPVLIMSAHFKHILNTGYDYSWFILTQKIIEKEFALSGSEQNPDITGKSWRKVAQRILPGAPPPVEAFKKKGVDFIVAKNLSDLVQGMNKLTDEPRLDYTHIEREVKARDREIVNKFSKDMQIIALRGSRNYLGDKLVRTAPPHPLLSSKAGPFDCFPIEYPHP